MKTRFVLFALASALLLAHAAAAQTRPDEGELRGLKLGLDARTMSSDRFGEFACGSNGGPPRLKLLDWSEFEKCRPEESGLREVYVRFDDFDEYVGRAVDDPVTMGRAGTRVAGHPIILSVLFDNGGIVRGLRFVSDPRADSGARRMAHMLRLAIINRYAPSGWSCSDSPAAAGETPVGGVFLKQRCEKDIPGRHLMVEARFLRKPGQSDTDPTTGEQTAGQFESWTRFELTDPEYKKP